MEVWESISARKSVRAYQPDAVPQETMRMVLEAGRLAPSAGNRQPWHFVVVTDPDARRELSKVCTYGGFLREAPVVIVACGNPKISPEWHRVDVAIAMEQMVLMATSEGLGTCWIGSMSRERVKTLLRIPDPWEVVAMLSMGYPREKIDIGAKLVRSGRRKGMDQILSSEEFGRVMSWE